MTLELGIDIGDVHSIAQVTVPHSIASLRQRLGRSGRRADAAILRMFIPEATITDKSDLRDRLRLQTVQSVSMVSLLLEKWYEPPEEIQYHFSTLVQQTLSVIAQYGSVRADQLYKLLCIKGPFELVTQTMFITFLKGLKEHDLITKLQDGQITLGLSGEKTVGHYTFYTAFQTPEEYRLEHKGHSLGTIPFDFPLFVEQNIIFAGQRWQVTDVDSKAKIIQLIPQPGGQPPIFEGGYSAIHDKIREEMYQVYLAKTVPVYLDYTAQESMRQGIDYFYALGLDKSVILEEGKSTYLIPWKGDKICTTIAAMLMQRGLAANNFAGVIEVKQASGLMVKSAVTAIRQNSQPTNLDLAKHVADIIREKHDLVVDVSLLETAYGAKHFDVDGAFSFFADNF
jgi:ATP-dependent Lhr-like helicase